MRKGGMLMGMAVGAGLVYLLDPQSGERRRGRLRQTIRDRMSDAPTQDLTIELPIGHYGSRQGDILGLESATLQRTPGTGPQSRTVTLLGGALALFGLARRGAVGAAAQALGAGMLWSELSKPKAAPGGRPERRRTVDIQKTLFVDAPVARVYEFWSDYENFPLFLSSVREVRDLGGGRSHWVVKGPGGIPVEWDAVLTEKVPGEAIAWRSRPGSLLENAGVVRFRAEGDGTRVDFRFCYNPPAGGAGRAVVELLGADPRSRLNDDFGRLKALLEGAHKGETHGGEPRG
jgi:uncharacterized membrane protein